MGNASKRYSAEVRDRAVRLFQEHVHEYPTRWESMGSIAGKIGCATETLPLWVLKAEATADPRRNAALADRERVKQLERENAELNGRLPVALLQRRTGSGTFATHPQIRPLRTLAFVTLVFGGQAVLYAIRDRRL